MKSADASLAQVLEALGHAGLLLRQDRELPCVVSLLAGSKLKSSWWSHPEAQRMFGVMSRLAEHPDVLLVKLLCGKDTFVHRDHWPSLLTVAMAREPWQMRALSAPARALLARTTRSAQPVPASGAAARELQLRLLVHATEVHTPTGRHALGLASWKSWARASGTQVLASAESARAALEALAHAIGARRRALPWGATAEARA